MSKCKVNDVIVSGDFNESVKSDNIKSFMKETGLFDVFVDSNGVEESDREATCQHDSRCIDYFLATDGTLRNVQGCELIECNEIVESDHRGNLTDINFAEYFTEDFAEEDDIFERRLNPDRKTHRDKFVEKCNKILESISIESELNEVNGNYDHAKIEQIDSDITYVLMKARESVEGDVLRNDKSTEQRTLRATLAYWTKVERKGWNKYRVKQNEKEEIWLACSQT